MKIVKRLGVFETNSSSSHTLTLVSKEDYEEDKARGRSKYRHYGVVATKEDKLLMACGCCHELFVTEDQMARYASFGDEYEIERKQHFDEVKYAISSGNGHLANMFFDTNVYYEVAMDLLVRVYCDLTGENYEQTYSRVDNINRSGRACHMKFFFEGALDNPGIDYDLIDGLFYGAEEVALAAIRRYFDDNAILLYREY